MVRALLVLLLLPPGALLAGEEDIASDPRAVSWYAWCAATEGRAAAIPDLRRYLREDAERRGRASDIARLFVLDALIRLKAPVSAEEIVPALARMKPVHLAAVILAVRGGDDATLLAVLDAFDGPAPIARHEEAWLAVGNALAARRAPGFAWRCLSRLTSVLYVYVDDRPRDDFYRWPGGQVPGDALVPIPPGYPPVPVYGLWDTDIEDTELLADGPRPVGFKRSVRTGRLFFGIITDWLDRDQARLEWLAALLEERVPALGIPRTLDRSVGYPSEKLFLQRVRRAREEMWAPVIELGRRLYQAGLMTGAELDAVPPRIVTKLIDRRSRKVPPLPKLSEDWVKPPLTPPPEEPTVKPRRYR